MKYLVTAVSMLWLAVAFPVSAQSRDVVVVELFTSQGCATCPPADALLGKLSTDSRVIALSLHVDYWDYMGWKDRFASPKFTARQKAYAHNIRDKMVFTPQVVVQGKARVVGNKAAEVEAAIQAQLAEVRDVGLRVDRRGEQLLIRADPIAGLSAPVWVQLVRFSPVETVAIDRGENAGKTFNYFNVVKSWQLLGKWDASTPLELEAEAPGPASLAVILQAEGPAEILSAMMLP